MRIGISILAVAISTSICLLAAQAQERPRVVVIPLMDNCEETEEPTGTASPGDVLFGETFSNSTTTGLIGSMPDRGAISITPSTSNQSIPAGYHNGAGSCAGDSDLAAENIKSGVEIFGVAGTSVEANGNATANQVLTGRTFSNSTANGLTGTMPERGAVNITPGTSSQTIQAGFHNGSGSVAGDADLTAENIKNGVDIFGVTGSADLLQVLSTGQTTSYATGDDGDLEKGASVATRFTDNGDGTVTDNLTNLVWLKDRGCPGVTTGWANALAFSNSLFDGWTGDGMGSDCGLSDGSTAGDWRLPNINELLSLVDRGTTGPALPSGQPFTRTITANIYWSSTARVNDTNDKWALSIGEGSLTYQASSMSSLSAWPVRDAN